MSLVSCHECGRQVSTGAISCPNCGAPREATVATTTPPIRWGRVGLGGIGVLVSIIAILCVSAPTQKQVHDESILPPPHSPEHHWTARVGRFYGYKRDVSVADQQNGIATKSMVLADYRGKPRGRYEFMLTDGGASGEFMTCGDEACTFVTSMGIGGQRVLPVETGSIIWAIVDDARNDQFK